MSYKNLQTSKVFILIFIILVVLLICGFMLLQHNKEPLYTPSKLTTTAEFNTQKNTKYGYEFSYSKNYRIQIVGNGIDINDQYGLQMADNQLENSIVYINTMQNKESISTLDYAIKYYTQALNYNGISLPKTSIITSSKVIDSKSYPFITNNGIKGYELYLIHEVTEKNRDKVKVYREKSQPYFIIELPAKTNTLLFIQGGDTSEGMRIIRAFLDSLQ